MRSPGRGGEHGHSLHPRDPSSASRTPRPEPGRKAARGGGGGPRAVTHLRPRPSSPRAAGSARSPPWPGGAGRPGPGLAGPRSLRAGAAPGGGVTLARRPGGARAPRGRREPRDHSRPAALPAGRPWGCAPAAAGLGETFHFPAAAAASGASSSARATSSGRRAAVRSFPMGSAPGCIFIAPTPRRSGASPPPLAPPPLPPPAPRA